MMGRKTLKEIRSELKEALAATGEDPFKWLEKRMAAKPRSVILPSLYDFLKAKPRKKRSSRRATAKK
jgi:hypothetical protein